MNEAPGERRGYPRFLVQLPIAFSGDAISGDGMVIDISKGGWQVTVATTQGVPVGTDLALRIALPDHAAPMEVTLAVVRWSKGQKFGLEYLRMEDEEQERLRRFVSTLETGPSH